MKFAGSLLLVMLLLSNILKAQDITKAKSYPEQVGDIIFNPKTDKANFELCDNGWTYEYYGPGTTYKGGAKALKSYLLTHYQYKPAYENISGYVTIRFLVSCKAQTDRFRVFQLDENYQKTTFDAGFITHLTTLCKSLNGWVAGSFNGKLNLGVTRMMTKDYKAAIVDLNRETKKYEKLADTYYYLSLCYKKLGQRKNAFNNFAQAKLLFTKTGYHRNDPYCEEPDQVYLSDIELELKKF